MNKYLREPYLNVAGNFSHKVTNYPSPNGQHSIVVSHCWEYRMGANACLFHLIDENEEIIENFSPLTTNSRLSWSQDSSRLAILIGEQHRGILLYDLEHRNFSFVKSNCYTFKIENEKLVLFISENFINQLNSEKLIGGGVSELPRVKYLKPEDIQIDISTLETFTKADLSTYYQNGAENEINIYPVEKGFWEFKGDLPQDTIRGYNGRDFEIYQLELFAKYGDEQSIEWLFEIKVMTENKYSKWDKVSKYLGNRKREK